MIRILIEKITEVDQPRIQWETIGRSENGESIYGWTPPASFPEKKKITTAVLEQFVSDDLDIPAVIAVINGLEKKA